MITSVYGPFWIAVAILILGFILLIFPPGFGNTFFGPKIKAALYNGKSWRSAQRLNALLYIIMGSVSAAFFMYDRKHPAIMLLIIIFSQRIGMTWIDNMLKKKYAPNEEINKEEE